MRAGDDAELDRLDWVVWELEVRDPGQLAAPGIGERTREAMAELAGAWGCVFVQHRRRLLRLVPGGTYYSWLVRVPRAEH